MDSHQHAEEDLTSPLLKSTGSQHFPLMESSEKTMDKTSFTFVVENYLSLCKGVGVSNKIESKPFMAGGHSWTIAFYPDGYNEHAHNGGRGHVSLFLCHKSRWNQTHSGGVDFVCSFTVLDQSDSRLDYGFDERRVFRHYNTLPCRRRWGFPKFMKRATVESQSFGYLRDDCIKIKADLGVFVDQQLSPPPVHDRFVFFKVGNKQFYAEESVLAKRCPNLLHDAIPEFERIVFEDTWFNYENKGMILSSFPFTKRLVKAMLWFIFKGKLHWQDKKAISDSRSDDPNSFALKMLEAADHFNLKLLKRQCQSIRLYDNPEVLVLYDTVVSNLKKPWRMASRLVSSKLKMI